MKTLVLLVCLLTSAVLAEDKECLGGVCIGDNFNFTYGFKKYSNSLVHMYKEINLAGVDGILEISMCGIFINGISFSKSYSKHNIKYGMERDIMNIVNGYYSLGYTLKEVTDDLFNPYVLTPDDVHVPMYVIRHFCLKKGKHFRLYLHKDEPDYKNISILVYNGVVFTDNPVPVWRVYLGKSGRNKCTDGLE